MKLHLPHSLFDAMKTIIANMPECATRIDLRIRPDEIPTMECVIECRQPDGEPIIRDGRIATELRRFEIIPEGILGKARAVVDTFAGEARAEEADWPTSEWRSQLVEVIAELKAALP